MKGIHDAPFALASDGTLLLNMTHMDGEQTPEALLERACATNGRVFIGVEVDDEERAYVVSLAHDGFQEAAAAVAGTRRYGR